MGNQDEKERRKPDFQLIGLSITPLVVFSEVVITVCAFILDGNMEEEIESGLFALAHSLRGTYTAAYAGDYRLSAAEALEKGILFSAAIPICLIKSSSTTV